MQSINSLEQRRLKDIAVLKVTTQLTGYGAVELQSKLDRLFQEEEIGCLIINLGYVDSIDSLGIDVVLSTIRSDIKTVLVDVNLSIILMLERAHSAGSIEVYRTEEEAILNLLSGVVQ